MNDCEEAKLQSREALVENLHDYNYYYINMIYIKKIGPLQKHTTITFEKLSNCVIGL